MEIKDLHLGICSFVTSVPKTYLCTPVNKSNGHTYLLVCVWMEFVQSEATNTCLCTLCKIEMQALPVQFNSVFS